MIIVYEMTSDTTGVVIGEYINESIVPHEVLYVETNELPEIPAPAFGKRPVLLIKPKTKELWYELVDRPLTQAEQITKLQTEKDQLDQRLQATEGAILMLMDLL